MPQQRSASGDTSLWPLGYALLVAALGLIFGYDLGTIFISVEHGTEFLILAETKSDILLGTYILGFIFGVFVAGHVTYGSGRKITLVASVTVGALAALASLVAPNFSVLLTSELAIGFSFGLYFIAALLYISEITLPSYRPLAFAALPTCACAGALTSLFSLINVDYLPLIVFSSLFTLTIIGISLVLVKLPESPRYLALSGSTDAALAVLFQLRHDMGMAARELAEINECCRGETRGIEFFLQNTTYRRLLFFICLITFMCNIAGVTIIPSLLLGSMSIVVITAGPEPSYILDNNIVVYCTYGACFVSLVIHAWLVHFIPRRTLVLSSFTLSLGCLIAAAVITLFQDGFIQRWLITGTVMLYLAGAIGSFVTYLGIACDLMPIRGREFGVAAIVLAHSFGILFGLQSSMPLLHNFGITGFFVICAATSAIILYLCRKYLPDPGKQSLEVTEMRIMSAPSLSRLNSLHLP